MAKTKASYTYGDLQAAGFNEQDLNQFMGVKRGTDPNVMRPGSFFASGTNAATGAMTKSVIGDESGRMTKGAPQMAPTPESMEQFFMDNLGRQDAQAVYEARVKEIIDQRKADQDAVNERNRLNTVGAMARMAAIQHNNELATKGKFDVLASVDRAAKALAGGKDVTASPEDINTLFTVGSTRKPGQNRTGFSNEQFAGIQQSRKVFDQNVAAGLGELKKKIAEHPPIDNAEMHAKIREAFKGVNQPEAAIAFAADRINAMKPDYLQKASGTASQIRLLTEENIDLAYKMNKDPYMSWAKTRGIDEEQAKADYEAKEGSWKDYNAAPPPGSYVVEGGQLQLVDITKAVRETAAEAELRQYGNIVTEQKSKHFTPETAKLLGGNANLVGKPAAASSAEAATTIPGDVTSEVNLIRSGKSPTEVAQNLIDQGVAKGDVNDVASRLESQARDVENNSLSAKASAHQAEQLKVIGETMTKYASSIDNVMPETLAEAIVLGEMRTNEDKPTNVMAAEYILSNLFSNVTPLQRHIIGDKLAGYVGGNAEDMSDNTAEFAALRSLHQELTTRFNLAYSTIGAQERAAQKKRDEELFGKTNAAQYVSPPDVQRKQGWVFHGPTQTMEAGWISNVLNGKPEESQVAMRSALDNLGVGMPEVHGGRIVRGHVNEGHYLSDVPNVLQGGAGFVAGGMPNAMARGVFKRYMDSIQEQFSSDKPVKLSDALPKELSGVDAKVYSGLESIINDKKSGFDPQNIAALAYYLARENVKENINIETKSVLLKPSPVTELSGIEAIQEVYRDIVGSPAPAMTDDDDLAEQYAIRLAKEISNTWVPREMADNAAGLLIQTLGQTWGSALVTRPRGLGFKDARGINHIKERRRDIHDQSHDEFIEAMETMLKHVQAGGLG